ncbi:MAG: hypothetical protein C0600_04490 [Ignavibacteria bacterium]|nr:MAG: hypothetical protein C0600_04490 [Ignavibacteria bacterium]
MTEFGAATKPSKLVPVLIGGGAMTVISITPYLNFINCACCAGIMGAAVLGVWFYKKSFPMDMPFSIGDGAAIGALSGVVGAFFTTILQFLMLSGGSVDLTTQLENAFDEAEMQATDPAAVEAARELIMQIAAQPMMLFLIGLLFALVLYVGFGALGGLIGGNIFKTKVLPQTPVEN